MLQTKIRSACTAKGIPASKSQVITVPVKITWEKKAKEVYIVGDFTYPQWTVKIPMVAAKDCHEVYLSSIKEGSLFKFIVDNDYECSSSYGVAVSDRGITNNCYTGRCSKRRNTISSKHTQHKIRFMDSQPCLYFNFKRWLSI